MCVRHEKLKNRCIQLAEMAIKEAFPNIVTFTIHFAIKTSNIFLSFHYHVPIILSRSLGVRFLFE